MKIADTLLSAVPLILLTLIITLHVSIVSKQNTTLDQYIMSKQCNYAVDAAADYMLDHASSTVSGANSDFVALNPKDAEYEFSAVLAQELGLQTDADSASIVFNKYCKAFAVCTYDGTYIYAQKKTSQYTSQMVSSPKIPYFYTDSSGTQYCLTLNPDKGYSDWTDTNGVYSLQDYGNYKSKPTEDVQTTAINDKVADLVNWALYTTYGGDGHTISLPNTSSLIRGAQPVNRPTVIAVISGSQEAVDSTVTATGIGGAQILTAASQVVGYTLSGITYNGVTYNGKYYSNSDWWNSHTQLTLGNTTSVLFNSAKSAAKSGYHSLELVK